MEQPTEVLRDGSLGALWWSKGLKTSACHEEMGPHLLAFGGQLFALLSFSDSGERGSVFVSFERG